MNLLCKIIFPDSGADYTAMQRIEHDSKQWESRILKGTEFSEAMGEDGSYEVPNIMLKLDDSDHKYRNKYIDKNDQYIQKIPVTLYTDTGTIIGNYKGESWSFPPKEFHFKLSNKIDFKKDFTEKINTTTWANAATNAINQVVPQIYNTAAKYKAWKIDTVNGHWLLGSAEISTITAIEINGRVIDSSFYSLPQNDGTYWWVIMDHPEILAMKTDFCNVSVTTPAYTPVEIITDMLSGTVTVAANTNFKTWLSNQGYTSSKCRFVLDRKMSVAEALKVFCQSFSSGWRMNSSNEVIFTWLDPDDITIDKIFLQANDDPSGNDLTGGCRQTSEYDPRKVKNKIELYYNKNYKEGKYDSFELYDGDNQGDRGIHLDSVELEYLHETIQVNKTAENRYKLNKEPDNRHTLGTTWEIGEGVYPGDKIQVRHWNNKTPNLMFGVVKSKRVNPGNHTVGLTFKEMDYLYPWNPILREDRTFILDEMGYPIISG